ncbi:hypothetical protein [Fluoribacter gormanii]|uniref:Uncharacterized protein n=1 Tax=Fluoribacter gormanii TaxID=464 RepID=A0A377GG41_9GAMM|nr:hypothetical protein [Fluoribacter gormanii]KTD02739.1 hypothetical protein Lgor_1616 [Fluoribacter gormanii]SIR59640.1 hypothetical protein SAMN05421777_11677 [Fluoribacter gormanii]STO23756.1 Uncharacterised protein [Fluoribacter gormanii]
MNVVVKITLILSLILVNIAANAIDNKFILEKCIKENTLDYIYCQGWHEGLGNQIIMTEVAQYLSKYKHPPKWFVELNENEDVNNDFFIRIHRNYLKKNPKYVKEYPQTSFMMAFSEQIQKYKE